MAGGNNVTRMPPRQRMINLMYIVLTAMLALNVSSDVLNGFSQVQEGLHNTNLNMKVKNEAQFIYLQELFGKNPSKTGIWMKKGEELHDKSLSLCLTIDSLKTEIARKADGKNADPGELINQDNIEAAAVTMLRPGSSEGKKLRAKIEKYKDYVCSLISDSLKRDAVAEMLSTKTGKEKSGHGNIDWEVKNFDNMPAIAAITLLTKLENDIRQAESDALSNIITNVDIGDVRVNELQAYVIPTSSMVMRGEKYTADIVLAAIDTTQRPVVYVNGSKLPDGNRRLEFTAGNAGIHEYSGHIEVIRGDGSVARHPFSSSYTVMEPMATISPTLMNVLYAGIDNPISISVPGVPMTAVQATMTNGTLVRKGDSWVARPGKVGTESTISVSTLTEGISRNVGSMTFHVRKLPDPSPFIPVKDAQGNSVNYRGAPKKISKASLLATESLGAAIDDDILNVSYTVVSFSTIFFDSMGNAIPEVSDGASFSKRQKEQFRRLKPGKSFFISNVKAKGPDGITRDISPMQVSLN